MKKKNEKDYKVGNTPPINSVNEPDLGYYVPIKPPTQLGLRREVLVKDFVYQDFKEIANKAPFTLIEWSDMLHMSERTLQRYAKENQTFNGLQVELILLAEKMIDMGNVLFGKEGFKAWLQSASFSLGNKCPKEFMNSYGGIQEVINLMGRIQHGISS